MIPHSRPWIAEADIERVVTQLRSGMLAEGAASSAVEHTLSAHFGLPHAVATGSGTQALALALRSLALPPGAEVMLPTYVCPEVLGVVEHIGAVPVLIDIDARYCLDADLVARRVSRRTGAILLPYLFGLYRDPAPFAALGVPLIEDCAQYLPMPADACGLHGDLVVCSFEATKLITGGEGGAVLTRDPKRAAQLRGFKALAAGYKLNLYPLSDLQAALVSAQLVRVDELLGRRRLLAARYRTAFVDYASLAMPPENPRDLPFRFVFALRDAPDDAIGQLIAAFAARGIAVRRPVDTLLHHFVPGGEFPGAERAFHETLSLPLYPALADTEQQQVIDVACELLDNLAVVREHRV